MVDSALHFAAGFFGVQQFPTSYHQLIQIEDTGFNSTLAPYDACANANNAIADIGTAYTTNWTAVVQAMQQLCAYETVALGYSAFCALFTEEEWRGYEYANDLQFWYGSGPGNPAAAAQGIGYVQELVARLTQTPLTVFDTTLNATLDGNNVTFPLHQPIYVDATHDTVISTIVVALNFTSMAKNGPLPADHIPKDQTYFAQHIAPFASNLVAQEPFIRFLLNDGVVPLTGIAHCAEDKDGLCALGDFVQGMKERIAEVDFAYDCFANYTVPVPDTIIDGRMHK
ncbi:3-phytase B [Grifola frondosa]|uniref:3-phytase B n=1 Tax=Grifola frondosa TaxID=5627 RepID=A0A1C7MS82_GRIFR|nr:3-phytase B [Grifola frondosa]